MDILINPSKLSGHIDAVSSKSDAHRILICAALADKPTDVYLTGYSKDIEATVSCLRSMGAKIEEAPKNALSVTPLWDNIIQSPDLNCMESGSTLRFILPIAAALGMDAMLTGSGRLPNRPITQLTEQLKKHGITFSGDKLPFEISGQLKGGQFEYAGDISSQFITGTLLSLPLLKEGSKIKLLSPLQSKGYIDMTIDTMTMFGINIQQLNGNYEVTEHSKYKSPKFINVEGDWSNAAFWLVAGALGEGISCIGLNPKSLQGDKAIINILKDYGARLSEIENSFTVKESIRRPLKIDASQIPDLVPVLAVLLSVADGVSEIYNAKRLRIKESDRLSAITNILKSLGADIEEEYDSLTITGKPMLCGGEVECYNDHRLAMAAAIASSVCKNPVIIKDAQAVNKSYPAFFEDFKKLGGNFNVI